MEYQDYNDEFHRYRTEGYKKQVKRKIQDHDRTIRHLKLEKRINKEHINELTSRIAKLGGEIKMLEKELHKMKINNQTLILTGDRPQMEELMNQNKETIYAKTKILVQNANEREMIKSNIRYLKANDSQLNKMISEEQQRKSKIVIC